MGNRLIQAIRAIRAVLARIQERHLAEQEARREIFQDQFNQVPPWLLYHPFIFNLHQVLILAVVLVLAYYIGNRTPQDDEDDDEEVDDHED